MHIAQRGACCLRACVHVRMRACGETRATAAAAAAVTTTTTTMTTTTPTTTTTGLLLNAVLQLVADSEPEIRDHATETNEDLLQVRNERRETRGDDRDFEMRDFEIEILKSKF